MPGNHANIKNLKSPVRGSIKNSFKPGHFSRSLADNQSRFEDEKVKVNSARLSLAHTISFERLSAI